MRPGRTRQRAILLTAGALLIAGGLLLGLPRYLAYVHGYQGTRFNPASVSAERPDYFYLDWRANWADLGELRAALGPDGVRGSDRDLIVDGQLRHDPLKVIQASLALHDQLLDEPSPEREEIFRRQLAWVIGEGAVLLPSGTPVWPQYYCAQRYDLGGRWISALTQGQAISLLVRGAAFTGDQRYADWARRAVRGLTSDELPIQWRDAAGAVFFEEYPCDPPAHVLNGCLFAWLGLWDYVRFSDDEDLRAFCLTALEDIRRTVPDYELGDWTRYDLHQTWPTSPSYQEIHAALARALGETTGDRFWSTRADRWRRAAANPWMRSWVFLRVLIAKIRTRLLGPPVTPRGLRLPPADTSSSSG
jgi:hypothetical protein